MNFRKNKFISLIIVLFVFFFSNTINVSAKTYDCSKEEYQCISCPYEYKKNYHYTYYAKTNKDGAVSITGKGKEKLISWDASSEGSYFLNDKKNKLICPDVYFQITPNKQDTLQIKISFTKLKTLKSNGNSFKSEKATLLKSKTDNGKPFKSSDSKAETKTCKNITIKIDGQTKQNTTELNTVKEKASVSITGNTIKLELPSPYKKSTSPVSSSIKASDFKDNCPTDILVVCFGTTTGAKGDKTYTCTLKKNSDLENRYIDQKTGKKINGNDTNTDDNKIYYVDSPDVQTGTSNGEIKCSDFSAFHTIYTIIVVMAPILVIVFGSLDFAKATLTSDMQKMQKFRKSFPLRLAAAFILIISPVIINLILSMGSSQGVSNTLMNCIITGKDRTIDLNKDTSQKTTPTSNAYKNKNSSNTELSSACSTACKNKYKNATTAFEECKNSCIKNYNKNCSSISEKNGRTTCYKDYAKTKAN